MPTSGNLPDNKDLLLSDRRRQYPMNYLLVTVSDPDRRTEQRRRDGLQRAQFIVPTVRIGEGSIEWAGRVRPRDDPWSHGIGGRGLRLTALDGAMPAHDLLHGLGRRPRSLGDGAESRALFTGTQNGHYVVGIDLCSLPSDLSHRTDQSRLINCQFTSSTRHGFFPCTATVASCHTIL